jgi:hypothetical protein
LAGIDTETCVFASAIGLLCQGMNCCALTFIRIRGRADCREADENCSKKDKKLKPVAIATDFFCNLC